MTSRGSGTTDAAPGSNGHGGRITRDDIEAKFRELGGEVDQGVEQAQNVGVLLAAVGVTALVVAAFLVGRRRGRRRQTVLEIRRI
jgi:hypothetical protein